MSKMVRVRYWVVTAAKHEERSGKIGFDVWTAVCSTAEQAISEQSNAVAAGYHPLGISEGVQDLCGAVDDE